MFIPESADIHAPGVYAIVNLNDGQGTAYIGQTTTSFRERIKNHRSKLNRGVHNNSHLQRAWDKYGASAFCFYVLEYVDSLEVIIKREQYWLDVFRDTGYVYNTGVCADAPWLGRSHSEGSRRKMREAQKGRKSVTKETRQRMSESAKRRFRLLGHPRQGQKNTPEAIAKMRIVKLGKASGHTLGYPAFYNRQTGEVIPAGFNLSKLCMEYGLDQAHMWAVQHRKRKSHKGWELCQGQ